MYLKKQNVIGTMFFVCAAVIVLVFSLTLTAYGEKDGKTFKGTDVEEIYDSIRNSGPWYEEWEESEVQFTNEGLTLVCTLTVPKTKKTCPIIITLTGFTGDREGAPIPETDDTIFKRTSRVLAGHGFASLRVDYRGYGDSEGDFTMVSFSTQISDILAAVEWITTDLKHRVNSKEIGIIGFSQGGLVGAAAAGRDKRVDSLVLWSPAAIPSITYEWLLLKQGIKTGLALPDGGTVTLGLYIDDQYIGFDVTLGKNFFQDLFNIDPVSEIRNYNNPLMVIVGENDNIVWPQPAMGQLYLKYHDEREKIVELDADHNFNYWDGPVPERLDDAIYWSTAWFIKTLK